MILQNTGTLSASHFSNLTWNELSSLTTMKSVV